MEVHGGYALRTLARAPSFDLPATDGKRYSLASFDGKPVLVVAWWCNHCPYVRAWEERTIALAREFAAKGVAFVAVSSNDAKQYPADSFEAMKDRATEKAYPFPYLFDESQEAARAFGAQVTPHFFVFDRERKLQYQGRLDDSKDAPSLVKRAFLREAIDAVLAGKPVEDAETPAQGCSVKWI